MNLVGKLRRCLMPEQKVTASARLRQEGRSMRCRDRHGGCLRRCATWELKPSHPHNMAAHAADEKATSQPSCQILQSGGRFFAVADVAAKLSYHQSLQRNLGRRIQKHVRSSLCQYQPQMALGI